MITFKTALKMSGADQAKPIPQIEYAYHAYKNGECKTFKTLDEAKKFSKLTERVILNKDEIDRATDEHIFIEVKAFAARSAFSRRCFKHALHEEYPHLSEEQFNLIWDYVCNNTHSYDEIVDEFEDRVNLISQFNLAR